MAGIWYGLLLVCLLMLGMLAVTVPFHEPGSRTYYITQFAAINLGISIILLSILIYFDWDPREYIFGE